MTIFFKDYSEDLLFEARFLDGNYIDRMYSWIGLNLTDIYNPEDSSFTITDKLLNLTRVDNMGNDAW